MIKFVFTLLISASPVFAAPVEFKTSHICDRYDKIVNYITSEFSETLLFIGTGFPVYYEGVNKKETETNMGFSVNQDSGSWSLIYIFQDLTACIMASGLEFKPYIK